MRALPPAAVFLLVVGATAACYWPGLTGPFLLDDFRAVERLGDFGGVRDWETFRLYVLGGDSGPLGRPLALLSFLLNATHWGGDAWGYKFTNLMLHLLNGVLLFAFCHRLMKLRGWEEVRSAWFALLVAGVWLLHPLNVSTTLYVVQRMTQLSSLFVLAGMNGYLHGRALLASYPRRGHLWMSASLLLGGALAILSKENGALLPLYLLVLEATLLAGVGPRPSRAWRWIFLYLPSIALPVLLIGLAICGYWDATYAMRPFDLPQRLLTEARVLWDYLFQWFFPRPEGRGLYAGEYPLSSGLLQPWITLPAVAGLLLLALAGVLGRRRHPFIAFAVLTFLAGQAVESTVVPLETYFEHRNYHPAMFLAFPLAAWLLWAPLSAFATVLLGAALLLVPAMQLYRRAELWGDEAALTLSWARRYPASQRAQRVMALLLERRGRPDLALAWLEKSHKAMPENIPIRIQELGLHCRIGRGQAAALRRLTSLLRRTPYDFRTYEAMHSLLQMLESGGCPPLGLTDARELVSALAVNPALDHLKGARRQVAFFEGELHARQGDAAKALAQFERSLVLQPDIDAGLLEVAVLAANGHYEQARTLLRRVHALVRQRPLLLRAPGHLDYEREIRRLDRHLKEDLAASRKGR